MTELERELTRLGREVEYPPSPRLAAAVMLRLPEEKPGVGPRRRARWRPLTARVALIVVAVVLLSAGLVLAAVPPARHALLDLVGLRGATIERVPSLS